VGRRSADMYYSHRGPDHQSGRSPVDCQREAFSEWLREVLKVSV